MSDELQILKLRDERLDLGSAVRRRASTLRLASVVSAMMNTAFEGAVTWHQSDLCGSKPCDKLAPRGHVIGK